MVIAFKNRSENIKNLVLKGLHLYVTSNLKRYEHEVKQGSSWSSQYLRKPNALQL